MPKKKTPSKVKAETTTKQERLENPPKQTTDEIDEIFASKKRKNPEVEESEKPKENVNGIPIKEKEKKKKKSEGSRRKTNDGLTIYSASELGINKPATVKIGKMLLEDIPNFLPLSVILNRDLKYLRKVDSMTEAGVKLH